MNKKRKLTFVLLISVLSLIGLIIFFQLNHSFFQDKKNFYAVFLTSGQVYFGHIDQLDLGVITLSEVYYLRTQSNLSAEVLNSQKEDANLQLSLVKLGKEFHGPTDQMMINRQQIIFWEKLRQDGEVVQAIKKYK